VADECAGEAVAREASLDEAPVARASEFAQARYFAEMMRTERDEARKAAREAQQRWSTRRIKDDAEIPERVVRLKRRVRETNRILHALEERFPGI
jgi:hypothetical protein